MALTASAQSALPLTWDETIVPALRKRLESESRILAKRMSTTSMTSLEDHYPHSSNPDATARERNASSTYSSNHGRPIPRSANRNNHQGPNGKAAKTHPRPDTAGSTVSKGPPRRTRTYSQSNTYDGPFQNGPAAGTNGPSNGLPTPGPSRSTSSLYQQQLQGRTSDVKPTRIPVVARGRTPSISSHGHSVHSGRVGDANRNGPQPSSPPVGAPPDLWAVEKSEPWNHSHSTVSVSSRQRSDILNETAPFEASSISSAVSNQYKRGYSYEEPATTAVLPRTSTDSDERPFEHWYRGDVYRNGGVGELRVGGKQEMLDIANYGHRYGRSKPSKGSSTGIGISTIDDFPAQRKRADSVTAIGARESFYMDEERAKELANVLHEDPLTDMEGDIDLDTSNSYMDHGPNGPNSSTPAVPNGHRGTTPSIKHSLERERNAPETRIPGPAPRQLSEPPLSQIPTQSLHRDGSEPPPFPSSSSSSASVSGRPSVTQPSSTHLPSETQKRRAKSPAASVSKKLKTKPSKSSLRSKTQDEKNRRSVANYPEPPPGDDMVDAIPSWTQPVPAGGNWDEVVLPVVARKRGLNGHYEQADGATHSRKRPGSERIEPAPGTFGYDHTKYRPPQEGDIPMNEFGQRPQDISIAEEEENRSRISTFREDDNRPAYVRPQQQQLSSAPFSHYAHKGKDGIPAIMITRPTSDVEREAKDEGAGCCKCVIM